MLLWSVRLTVQTMFVSDCMHTQVLVLETCEGLHGTFTFHRLLINFVSDTEVPAWKGYFYAALLFVVAITQAILLQQHFIRTYVAGMRTRTCVIAAVYSKVSIKMVVRHSDLAVLQWCL